MLSCSESVGQISHASTERQLTLDVIGGLPRGPLVRPANRLLGGGCYEVLRKGFSALIVVFSVSKGARRIFSLEFVVDGSEWQLADLSRQALLEFHQRFPQISLLDDDVQMKFWRQV